ncbi:MAG: hypothetical protein AAF311_09525 [Pseudomonadota bacterium]
MFIGHYGPAVYDVVRSGKVKLWQAFLAVQAIDIVFCVLALLGLEGAASLRDGALVFEIDFSHSFVGAVLIAFAAAGLYRATNRGENGSMRGFWIIFVLAFSHWPLDWLVHRPDLVWVPGSETYLGLGLWDYAWPTYMLEVLLLGTAVAFWMVKTAGPRWTMVAAWATVALISVVHFFSITEVTLELQSGTLDVAALPSGVPFAISGLVFFIGFAAWIGWLESKRTYS